jgi:hypothetical protein
MKGIDVIYRIREYPGITAEKLIAEYTAAGQESVQGVALALHATVARLADLGFVEIEFGSQGNDPELRLTRQWDRVCTALDISVTRTRAASRPGAMVVQPMFGEPRIGTTCDVFVAMPFDKEMDEVYRDHIAAVAQSMGLTCLRADDVFAQGSLMNNMWAHIALSKVIVADCTGRNPNVFYEIGLAHAIGRAVVLITQDAGDMPFDLRHLLFIKYDRSRKGLADLRKNLQMALEAALVS